jgi:hypothetical protein
MSLRALSCEGVVQSTAARVLAAQGRTGIRTTRRVVLMGLAGLGLAPVRGYATNKAKTHKRRTKRPRTITVYDHTTAGWEGFVEKSVNDFRAVMPKQGPRLLYQRGSPDVCAADITVCTGDTAPYWGLARGTRGNGNVVLTDVADAPPGLRQAIVCHEMMHALTGIRDCYGCRPDSCVHGWRSTPGPFDVKKLARVFGTRARRR